MNKVDVFFENFVWGGVMVFRGFEFCGGEIVGGVNCR